MHIYIEDTKIHSHILLSTIDSQNNNQNRIKYKYFIILLVFQRWRMLFKQMPKWQMCRLTYKAVIWKSACNRTAPRICLILHRMDVFN